jgi:hypothetical protein
MKLLRHFAVSYPRSREHLICEATLHPSVLIQLFITSYTKICVEPGSETVESRQEGSVNVLQSVDRSGGPGSIPGTTRKRK